MPRSRRTRDQFAFRADRALAAFLQSLPNASEFIRRAVLRDSGLLCPLCSGSGTVPCGIGEHFAELAQCACCDRAAVADFQREGRLAAGGGASGEPARSGVCGGIPVVVFVPAPVQPAEEK